MAETTNSSSILGRLNADPENTNATNNKNKECTVCYGICKPQDFHPFSKCMHGFCKKCIKYHIQYSIKKHQAARCLSEGCSEVLQIQSPNIRLLPIGKQQRYYKILAASHLQRNEPHLRLCPDRECDDIIDLNVCCSAVCIVCKHNFCKRCLLPSHFGYCNMYSQQSSLMKEFGYKKCTKCKRLVQKNQGCDHITCRCGNQFCYLCGKQWKNHSKCKKSCFQNCFQTIKKLIILFMAFLVAFLVNMATLQFIWSLFLIAIYPMVLIVGQFFPKLIEIWEARKIFPLSSLIYGLIKACCDY